MTLEDETLRLRHECERSDHQLRVIPDLERELLVKTEEAALFEKEAVKLQGVVARQQKELAEVDKLLKNADSKVVLHRDLSNRRSEDVSNLQANVSLLSLFSPFFYYHFFSLPLSHFIILVFFIITCRYFLWYYYSFIYVLFIPSFYYYYFDWMKGIDTDDQAEVPIRQPHATTRLSHPSFLFFCLFLIFFLSPSSLSNKTNTQ